jgi:O-antigen ligase
VPLIPTHARGLATRIILLEILAAVTLLFLPFFGGRLQGWFRSRVTSLDRWILLWLLVSGLGILVAPNFGFAIYKSGYALSLAVLFYGYTSRIRTYEKGLVFLSVAFFSATLVAFFELILPRTYEVLFSGETQTKRPTESFLYMHAYLAAQYLVPVLVMALAFVANRAHFLFRAFAGLAALPMLVYLYAIGSRGTYLTLLSSLALVLVLTALRLIRMKDSLVLTRGVWLSLPILLALVLSISLLSAVGVLGPSGLWVVERVTSFFNPDLADFNFSRLAIWRDALYMGKDSLLLGVGLNNFPMVFPSYHMEAQEVAHAHNQFLQIFCENGALGLLCFLAVLWHLFRAMRRNGTQDLKDDLVFTLRTGAAGSLVAAGIYCCFETPLEWPASAFFLMLPISILLLPLPGGQSASAPAGLRRWPWLVIAPLAALLWFLPGLHLVKAVKSGLIGDVGFRWFALGEYEEAGRHLEEADAVWPYRSDILDAQTEVLILTGRVEEACAVAKRSLTIKPGGLRALGFCGRCLMRLGRFKEAKKYFKAYLKKVDLDQAKDIYYLLGRVYLKTGAPEAALAVFRRLHKAGYHKLKGPALLLEMARALLALTREPSTILNLVQDTLKMKPGKDRVQKDILMILDAFETRFYESEGLVERMQNLKAGLMKTQETQNGGA